MSPFLCPTNVFFSWTHLRHLDRSLARRDLSLSLRFEVCAARRRSGWVMDDCTDLSRNAAGEHRYPVTHWVTLTVNTRTMCVCVRLCLGGVDGGYPLARLKPNASYHLSLPLLVSSPSIWVPQPPNTPLTWISFQYRFSNINILWYRGFTAAFLHTLRGTGVKTVTKHPRLFWHYHLICVKYIIRN